MRRLGAQWRNTLALSIALYEVLMPFHFPPCNCRKRKRARA